MEDDEYELTNGSKECHAVIERDIIPAGHHLPPGQVLALGIVVNTLMMIAHEIAALRVVIANKKG